MAKNVSLEQIYVVPLLIVVNVRMGGWKIGGWKQNLLHESVFHGMWGQNKLHDSLQIVNVSYCIQNAYCILHT